jgi:hypothetical protein
MPASIYQNNDLTSKEHTLQIDYAHSLKLVTIEVGGMGIFRKKIVKAQAFSATG